MSTFNAETADNLEDIEKQFAVKAVEQMMIYWKLLESVPGSKLKLTKDDNAIFESFLESFPEYKDPAAVKLISEQDLKSKAGKEKWRNFCEQYKDVEDYNFGTMLRTDSSREYDQDNSIFVVKIQFYAFEIARNKYGLNDWVCKK